MRKIILEVKLVSKTKVFTNVHTWGGEMEDWREKKKKKFSKDIFKKNYLLRK